MRCCWRQRRFLAQMRRVLPGVGPAGRRGAVVGGEVAAGAAAGTINLLPSTGGFQAFDSTY